MINTAPDENPTESEDIMKYIIINRSSEISKNHVKKHESIINAYYNAYFSDGLQNDSYKVIATFCNIEDAKKELEKYKCTISECRTAVNFYSIDIYFIEEQEWNGFTEKYEPTGDYNFAEIAEEE